MQTKHSKKTEPFAYGRSPNPRSWFEGADALRSLKHPHIREKNPLEEQLKRIEKLLTIRGTHAPLK